MVPAHSTRPFVGVAWPLYVFSLYSADLRASCTSFLTCLHLMFDAVPNSWFNLATDSHKLVSPGMNTVIRLVPNAADLATERYSHSCCTSWICDNAVVMMVLIYTSTVYINFLSAYVPFFNILWAFFGYLMDIFHTKS